MSNQKVNSFGIAGSIYANYIIQSIAIIVIMQFSNDLMHQLNTDIIGLGYVASGIGVGKVLLMFVGGVLSDRFGRKPFVYLGMLCYAIFFICMTFTTNINVAFALAIIVGMGNSFLDTGSMPTLTECFPRSAGSASILIKAFISLGSLILPFIVTFVDNSNIWFGFAFIAFAVYLLINGLILAPQTFPSKDTVIAGQDGNSNYFIGKPKFWLEGFLLLLMGFTTTATFIIVLQWLPAIAQQGVGMPELEAKRLISYYSVGSIISVFFTAFIVKTFLKPIFCIIILPLLSAIILGLFYLNFTSSMFIIAAIGIGVTAAGGVLQLTLVVTQQLFPNHKGLAVGCIYTLSGISYIVVPQLISLLIKYDVKSTILVNFGIAVLSVIFGLGVYMRFIRVIDMKKI